MSSCNIEFPESESEARRALSDPNSALFAHKNAARYDALACLPYQTGSLRAWGKHLSHVVRHIYIAIKAGDLRGTVAVTAEELEQTRLCLARGQAVPEAFSRSLDPNYMGDVNTTSDWQDLAMWSSPVGKTDPTLVSLSHWTAELRRLLETRDCLPVRLRVALMKVYYALCLSRGQHLDVSLLGEILELLAEGHEAELAEAGLVLPWEPFLAEYEALYGSPDYPDETKFLQQSRYPFLPSQLWELADQSSDWFAGDDTEQIVRRVLERFSTLSENPCFSALPTMTPIHFEAVSSVNGEPSYHRNDARRYLPVFFRLKKDHPDKSLAISIWISRVSSKALQLFARRPETVFWGDFGVFSEAQFAQLVTSLSALSSDSSNSTASFRLVVSECRAVVYSLSGSKRVLEEFSTLVNSLHASAASSSRVGYTVSWLCEHLRSRVVAESRDPNKLRSEPDLGGLPDAVKLGSDTLRKIVHLLLPPVLLSLARGDNYAAHYHRSLVALVRIAPEQTLDGFLLGTYRGLEALDDSQLERLVSQIAVVLPHMADKPIYRVHCLRLLRSLLSSPSVNTLLVESDFLDAVTQFALLVPFQDLTFGRGNAQAMQDFTDSHVQLLEQRELKAVPVTNVAVARLDTLLLFQTTPFMEGAAVKSASSQFPEFLRELVGKTLGLLEDMSGNSAAGFAKKLPKLFAALMCSVSDDLFGQLRGLVFDHVTRAKHSCSVEVGQLVAEIVRRDPGQFAGYLQYLSSAIEMEIRENRAGSSRSAELLPRDHRLKWCVDVLCGAVSGSPDEVLRHGESLDSLVGLLTEHVKTSSVGVSSVLKAVLRSVASVQLLERRLISPEHVRQYGGVDEKAWGGLRFKQARFDKANLKFQWHVPQPQHVEFAVGLLEKHVSKAMVGVSFLAAFLKEKSDPQAVVKVEDEIRAHFAVISDGLSGVCELFDARASGSVGGLVRGYVLDESSPHYGRLHGFREDVGRFLHQVCGDILAAGNGAVLQSLTRSMRVFLQNVGFDCLARDPNTFVPSQTQDISHLEAPYTRPIMGTKLQELHRKCLKLSRASRTATGLDLALLRDVVHIAAAPLQDDGAEARATFSDCCATLFGATSVLYEVFPLWRAALDRKDTKAVENIVETLCAPRVVSLFESCDRNLEVADLLAESIQLDDETVTSLCLGVMSTFSEFVPYPLTVCLINNDLVESLRPADADLEIAALAAAKKAKHGAVLGNITALQNRFIQLSGKLGNSQFLKSTLDIVTAFNRFQGVALNREALLFMVDQVSNENLQISVSAWLGMGFVLQRINMVAENSYDIEQLYRLDYSRRNVMEIDTTGGFSLKRELANMSSPAFYLDDTRYRSCLVMPKRLLVVKRTRPPPYRYSDEDVKLLKEVGARISRDWFASRLEAMRSDFDYWANQWDSHTIVANTVATLAVLGYSKMSVADYLACVEELIRGDNCETNRVAGMLYFGIMACYYILSEADRAVVDMAVASALKTVLGRLKDGDQSSAWTSIFIGSLCARSIDMRRFPRTLSAICDTVVLDDGRNPANDAMRLSAVKEYVSNNGIHQPDVLLQKFAYSMHYSDEAVCVANAGLLAAIFEKYPQEPAESLDGFLQQCRTDRPTGLPSELVTVLDQLLKQVATLRAQAFSETNESHGISRSGYHWAAKFILEFLTALQDSHLRTQIAIVFDKELMRFLYELSGVRTAFAEDDYAKFFAFLSSVDLERSPGRFLTGTLFTCGGNWSPLPHLSEQIMIIWAAQTYVGQRLGLLPLRVLDTLLLTTDKLLLESPHPEVLREAATLFGALLRAYPVAGLNSMVEHRKGKFLKVLTEDYKDYAKKTKVYGAVLGLGCLVKFHTLDATPPRWLPQVVQKLATLAIPMGLAAGQAATKILQELKTEKKLMWKSYRQFFTEEQQEYLEELRSDY